MEIENLLTDNLEEDLFYLGAILGITVLLVGVGNLMADEPTQIGPVEVQNECVGLDVGVCLGFLTENHVTHNYDDYEAAEPGTEDYYRKIEAELMIQAYDICGEDTRGMDWVSEAEYDGQSGEEWLEEDEVELLPCEHTFYSSIEDSPELFG